MTMRRMADVAIRRDLRLLLWAAGKAVSLKELYKVRFVAALRQIKSTIACFLGRWKMGLCREFALRE